MASKLEKHLKAKSPLKASAVPLKTAMKAYGEKHKWNLIIPHLFLGNEDAAKDKNFFKNNKIKAVLNCTKDIPHYFSSDKNIEYLRIPIHDAHTNADIVKMRKFIPLIVEYIYKHVVILKQNILVHCAWGASRSATAVAVYLINKMKMTPEIACETVMKKRNIAFFYGRSVNFEKSILDYYNELKKCNIKRVE